MRALLLADYNRLEYTDVPDPEVGPGQVLVRIAACGICGSDVHGLDGSTGRRMPPLIMGHEAAGEVVEAKPAAKGEASLSPLALAKGGAGPKVGDRVALDSTLFCGACLFCRRGLTNLCDHRRVLGVSCEEYRMDGAFAEFIAVPQEVVHPLPDGLSFRQATLVEPLSVAVHAVNLLPRSLGDTAVVVGAGVIGLMAVQALRAAGCGRVISIEPDDTRRTLALQLGAEVALDPRTGDPLSAVRELTGGLGADLAIEAVGIRETVGHAARCLRKGGTLALVGNVSPAVELPLQAAVTRELRLIGSYGSRGEYPRCLDMIARGAVAVDPLISAVAPLAEGADWFARLRRREAGLIKVILTPSQAR